MIAVQLGRARRVAVATATALVVTGCGGGATAQSDPGYVTGPGVVTRTRVKERVALPRVTGALLHGGKFDSAEYPDTVLVYNVWGSWCAPCRAEAPGLQEVWERTRDRRVQFVGVNVKDNDPGPGLRADVRHHVSEHHDRRLRRGAAGVPLQPAAQCNPQHSRCRPQWADGRPNRGATTYTKLRRLIEEVLAEPT